MNTPEWLVTDQRGAFAMGTSDGLRSRKYHGFFMTLAGRSELGGLVDLELICNGRGLWPHLYGGPEGPVIHPDVGEFGPAYRRTALGPEWRWDLPEGALSFAVEPHRPGGIRLAFRWQSSGKQEAQILLRPFWGMRPLHATGGAEWRALPDPAEERRLMISNRAGQELLCAFDGPVRWVEEDPLWYHRFHYSEEFARGYPGEEDLQARGFWEGRLKPGTEFSLAIAEDPNDLGEGESLPPPPRAPALDFVLTRPAGIVAGFPWFGEWGRDTFIALPGVAMSWLGAGESAIRVGLWVEEVLDRWGKWIAREGMLPNLIERNGLCQWQSSDATLWWCHGLAALWQFSLAEPFPFPELELKYRDLLGTAIRAIESGRHRYLRVGPGALLEVTEADSTWMDAKVDGRAVVPRTGRLPEINALWFQARALHSLWSGEDFSMIERIGKESLALREPGRPNTIFLHSIPLAPSFVLSSFGDGDARLRDELAELAAALWTPVGLRTLDPRDPAFRPHCEGDQTARDRAYHQGTVWGWLGGHFEMARQRAAAPVAERIFPPALLAEMPIEGHIPEIFDAVAPFAPRGAPAQAWSLACHEEALARRNTGADAKLRRVIAERGRARRESRAQS